MGAESPDQSPKHGTHRGLANWTSYFSIYGSVIPRSLPWAILGCIEGSLLKWASNNYEEVSVFLYWQQGGAWYHPYAFHVFGMMLGFALVMRIQIACEAPPRLFSAGRQLFYSLHARARRRRRRRRRRESGRGAAC